MWSKIMSFIMSIVMLLCSILGIDFGAGKGGDGETIKYSDDKTSFEVILDENPTTGYEWTYDITDEGIISVSCDKFVSASTPGLVGVGGMRAVLFTADAQGKTTVVFSYARSWESAPIRTVTIEVTVSDGRTVDAQLISDTAAE